MSKVTTIPAETRDRAGKGTARAVRLAGKVPGVIYGDKKEPIMINVEKKTLDKQLHSHGFFARQFDIEIDGTKHHVLARDVQFHPVNDNAIHVDFLRVTANTKVKLNIEVAFLNEEESPGLKGGGVLNVVRHDIEVFCLVSNIPDRFEIDLTGLDVGASIHISHIDMPEGVTPTITDRDFTIATLAPPTVIVEPEPIEEEGEEGVEGEGAAAEGEESSGEGEESSGDGE